MRKNTRAGGSARRRFAELRTQAIRRNWRDWVFVALMIGAAIVGVVLLGGAVQLLAAFVLGLFVAIAIVGWMIGGDVHSLTWLWGAVGEEQTAEALATLDEEAWWVGHDLPAGVGNLDHVVIGPGGVFLIDSKRLFRPARVQTDALVSGRMLFGGGGFRRAAVALGASLANEVGWRPWVQAVVVVWGETQMPFKEVKNVVYIDGRDLAGWLQARPTRLTPDKRDALIKAAEQLTR